VTVTRHLKPEVEASLFARAHAGGRRGLRR